MIIKQKKNMNIRKHLIKNGSVCVKKQANNLYHVDIVIFIRKKLESLKLFTYFSLSDHSHNFRRIAKYCWKISFKIECVENMAYSIIGIINNKKLFIKDKYNKNEILFDKRLGDYRYYLQEPCLPYKQKLVNKIKKSKLLIRTTNQPTTKSLLIKTKKLDNITKCFLFLDGEIWQKNIKIYNYILHSYPNSLLCFIYQKNRSQELTQSDEFLRIVNELIPNSLVKKHIVSNKTKFYLVGSSFGGYFTCKSTTHKNTKINKFLALSPSLFVNKKIKINTQHLTIAFGSQESQTRMIQPCKKIKCKQYMINGSHDYSTWTHAIKQFFTGGCK